jgi:hypothetical protein
LALLLARSSNDERNLRSDFIGGVLAPFAIVAKVVTVIAPEDDDGIF